MGGSIAGRGGPEVDVYNLSGEGSQPRLLASEPVGTKGGHGGHFPPDGLTCYATGLRTVDIDDPLVEFIGDVCWDDG